MGRQAVRAAVQAFFTPATVTGLATIHAYPEKVTPEGEFDLAAGGMGAVVFVQLEQQREKRIALGGGPPLATSSGIKWRGYVVTLICIYRGGGTAKAQDVGLANDQFLDAMVARIQSDRKLGAPTVIFQSGEGTDTGGDDIEVQAALPRSRRGGIVDVFSTIRFRVNEIMYA